MSVLDAAALAGLRELDLDGSLWPRLCQAFERSVERLLPEIEESVQGGLDLDRLRRAAHTLKSASANMAALRLAELCGEIEQQAKEGRRDGVPEQVACLRAELQQVRRALRSSA